MKNSSPLMITTLILTLSLLSLSATDTGASPASAPVLLSGTIERTTHQQLITTIPAGTLDPPVPFLSSPSGKYTAYLLRTATAPTAGGFGNDFCYIQVQDTTESSGTPVWESECTPVSTDNACSLVFTDDGLAIFDGSTPQWDCGAESDDNDPLERVEMVDEGDMRIRDKIGELAWRASDDPMVNQRCGEPGSPGLAPVLPPFAQPIGGGGSLAFGQQGQQAALPGGIGTGASQTFGFGDNGALYGGGERRGVAAWGLLVACWLGFGLAF